MNLAHMIGQHHYDSFVSGLQHSVFSWAGVVVAITLGVAIGTTIYSRSRKLAAKQEVRK